MFIQLYKNNEGGMCDLYLFLFWFILNKYKPKFVIESGVWNGISTQLIIIFFKYLSKKNKNR